MVEWEEGRGETEWVGKGGEIVKGGAGGKGEADNS